MRKYRLRVGLDADDVLYECNSYALSIINARHAEEEPISINEIKGWDNRSRRSDERIALFSDPEFVRSQPVYPGAKEFVRELAKFADVFIVTAVPVPCMSARGERILEDFPDVPPQNIIIGTRKDVITLDILLDDGAHNISSSRAAYPVLFRRPWNTDLSGILAVNSYNDFLQLCKMVRNSFTEKINNLSKGGVVCLVGPSGTQKNEIAEALTGFKGFERPVTSTTRPRRDGEPEARYRFISEEQFLAEKEQGRYIENTVYSKYHFGTSMDQIEPIVRRGHLAVIPIDICGALSICNAFRKHSLLVFLNRPRQEVVRDIVEREIESEDKVRRILSLDFEYRNAEVCDVELPVDGDPQRAAEQLNELIRTRFFGRKENAARGKA